MWCHRIPMYRLLDTMFKTQISTLWFFLLRSKGHFDVRSHWLQPLTSWSRWLQPLASRSQWLRQSLRRRQTQQRQFFAVLVAREIAVLVHCNVRGTPIFYTSRTTLIQRVLVEYRERINKNNNHRVEEERFLSLSSPCSAGPHPPLPFFWWSNKAHHQSDHSSYSRHRQTFVISATSTSAEHNNVTTSHPLRLTPSPLPLKRIVGKGSSNKSDARWRGSCGRSGRLYSSCSDNGSISHSSKASVKVAVAGAIKRNLHFLFPPFHQLNNHHCGLRLLSVATCVTASLFRLAPELELYDLTDHAPDLVVLPVGVGCWRLCINRPVESDGSFIRAAAAENWSEIWLGSDVGGDGCGKEASCFWRKRVKEYRSNLTDVLRIEPVQSWQGNNFDWWGGYVHVETRGLKTLTDPAQTVAMQRLQGSY